MKLHSDENIRCASQRSSLVRFFILLNWVLPSSVLKKNPTATCLFGQFKKMNPWLSWALLVADHKHICIFIAPAEFSELTNIFATWVSASGIANWWASCTPWFQQAQPNHNPQAHWVSSCPCSRVFLLSLPFGAGHSLGSAESTPLCLRQGETSNHRQWVDLLLALSLQQVKEQQDKTKVLT